MKIDQITTSILDCSFCGTAEADVDFMVEGNQAYICDECVTKASDIVKENLHNNTYDLTFNLQKPIDIKKMLDVLQDGPTKKNNDGFFIL